MIKLLVSVRSLGEAAVAANGGADIIDVKEPSRGSLGAANVDTVVEIADAFSSRGPVSAVCGELLDVNDWPCELLPSNLAFAKIGLAGCQPVPSWPDLLSSAWARMPKSIEKVAVAYADWQGCVAPTPEQVVQVASANSCNYFLLDTSDKTRSLLESVPYHVIDRWIDAAHEANLKVVLAGSLVAADLPLVTKRWFPAVVAVRGAVCAGTRESAICEEKNQRIEITDQ